MNYQDRIFVFGSNTSGRHGKGAALEALRFGAIKGKGIGLMGQSYAIPTKDAKLQPLTLELIESYVEDFVIFTHRHPQLRFYVTPVGCGLAGYNAGQIAPMFQNADNCWFHRSWKPFMVAKSFEGGV